MILDVPWNRVRPLESQPRSYFDKLALEELARSIKAIGLVVPAQVYPLPKGAGHDYELIDGQRRWHAVQMAKLSTLRVQVVDEPDEEKRYVLSVVANLSRQGHHAMEIAVACDRIRRSLPLTMTGKVAHVADLMGKGEPWVYQHLSLLNLCDELREALHPACSKAKRIPFSVAVKLAGLDHFRQRAAYHKILSSGVSPVRAVGRALAETDADGESPSGADAPPLVSVSRDGVGRTLNGVLKPETQRRRTKIRSYYQGWRDIDKLIRRTVHDLEGYSPTWFAGVVKGRPSEDLQVIRNQLGRLAGHVEKLIEAIGGVK